MTWSTPHAIPAIPFMIFKQKERTAKSKAGKILARLYD
ncbi:hypothetical protein CHCC20335_0825 [Bacillus paralicheniformis]|nr:hypothetical protein CHCC20335_0825 [Bacillus paralicheniformis]